MLIEIHCGNLSEYDPLTGRSRACGQIITVDSNQIGELIECPKCHQAIEVSASKYDPQKASPKPDSRKRAEKPTQRQVANPAARPRTKSSASAPSEPPGRPAPSSRPARSKPKPGQHRDLTSRSDPMAMEITDQQLESMLSTDQGTRCVKCGHPAPRGRCTACRHVDRRFEKLHRPLDDIKIELTGLQRWACQTLSEGMSMRVLINVAHAFVAIPSVLLIALAIFGIAGNGMGPVAGTLLLIAVVLADLFYLGMVFKGQQFLRNPRARLAWFQKPFWYLLLVMARWMEWKSYDSRLKDRRVITVHDPEFSDLQIGQLEGIRAVQVLDLENTGITDRGLALMYRLEHLQCVVVRRTKVTPEAVFRLQQSFPKLWVWQ